MRERDKRDKWDKRGKKEINGEKLEVKNVACMDNAG